MNASPRELANRANATKSTGPITPEGKEKSSKNAITTALTGRTILLASDNLDTYEKHVHSHFRHFKPITDYEYGLVQSLADTAWRLQRIPHLMMALEAKGYEDFANDFQDMEPGAREARIEMEAFLKYEKQYRNLALQETRLHRRHEKDVAELRRVIQEREVQRARELDTASKNYLAAQHDGTTFDPADLGFDFPLEDVISYLNGKRAALIARDALMQPSRDLMSI